MTQKILILCSFLMIGTAEARFLGIGPRNYSKELAKLDERIGNTTAEQGNLESEVAQLDKSATDGVSDSEVARLNSQITEENGRLRNAMGKTERRDLEAKIRNLRRKRDNLLDQSGKAEKKNTKISSDIGEIKGEIQRLEDKKEDKTDAWIKALEEEIRNAKIGTKISNLRNKLSTMDANIEALRRVYDDSMIGEYMKDKVTALLNSEVMCRAAVACVNGSKETPRVKASDVESQLFKSSGASKSEGTAGGSAGAGGSQ